MRVGKIKRYLHEDMKTLGLKRQKMVFISGPRQVGKTTDARNLQADYDESHYFNFDQSRFKKQWTKDPDQIVEVFALEKLHARRLLILDEIHKSRKWKQKLKGIYDLYQDSIDIIVTGSARLNVYKKGGDSLLGRYVHVRLHPFSLAEVLERSPMRVEACEQALFQIPVVDKEQSGWKNIQDLYQYSGFPEPWLAKQDNIHRIWQKDRREKIVREDLRDLSNIREIQLVETLWLLLRDRVASPLSIQSLREDLDVAHDTVSRWLGYLKELYVVFEIKPYTKSIARSIKKEGKLYFYDWSEIEDDGARFENFVASHLLKACHYWEDTGQADMALCYLRNKDKKEVDFLLLKNNKPWFTVECKFKDTAFDVEHVVFQKRLCCPHIQVVMAPNVFRKVNKQAWIMGIEHFLRCLV